MAIRRYTAEELCFLRSSPLVQKPDNLPAIEQWIDEATQQQQTTTQKKTQRPGLVSGGLGGESSPMGSFSTGQRPALSRPATSRNGEDISLGPPRTMFPSSRHVAKLSDFQDRNASGQATGENTPGDEADNNRSRFFSDRQMNRRGTNDREGRDSRESWTSARERRALGLESDDHGRDKGDRYGRSDKDHDGERRNGFGDRHDARWSNNREDRRHNGDRPGGWREREQQRRDRDGDRGHVEKDPEWMDDPVMKKDQELGMGMARTQEEFQKWKESMNKGKKAAVEKEEPLEAVSATPAPSEPETKPANAAPLKLEGFDFAAWGATNPMTSGAPTPASKPGSAKPAKASRFASMFKPVDEPSAPAEMPTTQAVEAPKATAEDKDGFNRVLQMLGSTKIAQTPTPSEQVPTSPQPGKGGRPKSRFTDLFEARSPERIQPALDGGIPLRGEFGTNLPARPIPDDPEAIYGSGNQSRGAQRGLISPDGSGIPFNAMREQQTHQARPSSGRINDFGPMFDPPSRGAATPDNNIHNLLAQQRNQRPAFDSSGSQQLLNLLKMDASRTADKQASGTPLPQGPPKPLPEMFQRYASHEGQPSVETHAPKPRMPHQPPGLFEEQLMRNFSQEAVQQQIQELPQRRTSQRGQNNTVPPPGFFDEQQILLQQQQQQQMRRNYEAQQQQQFQQQQQQQPRQPQQPPPGQADVGRRIGNHPNSNMPPHMQMPMQMPPQQQYQGPPPPGEFPGGLPPPGFNPHMPRHHPPGFHNIPNMFQQPQQQSRGDPMPPPPNGGYPGGAGGPPPGFFGMPPPHIQQQMRAAGGYGMPMPPPGASGVGEQGRR